MTEKVIEKALGVVCILGVAAIPMADGYRGFLTFLGALFLIIGFGRDLVALSARIAEHDAKSAAAESEAENRTRADGCQPTEN